MIEIFLEFQSLRSHCPLGDCKVSARQKRRREKNLKIAPLDYPNYRIFVSARSEEATINHRR